jgi:hypothetical protein
MDIVTEKDAGSLARKPTPARGPRLWQARPRWMKSGRSREEDAQREDFLSRLRELVGDDQYEDLIAGRVIMNPYLLEDLDRLAEWHRQQGVDDPLTRPPKSVESDDQG